MHSDTRPAASPICSPALSLRFSLASLMYAKIVVDSVNTTTRQIFFRATRNPNCGFRSFQPGVPKD